MLTKPAEVAKQQMSKRCQDLASFMESLMEEPLKPSPNDQLQLEIQDTDHSYYVSNRTNVQRPRLEILISLKLSKLQLLPHTQWVVKLSYR